MLLGSEASGKRHIFLVCSRFIYQRISVLIDLLFRFENRQDEIILRGGSQVDRSLWVFRAVLFRIHTCFLLSLFWPDYPIVWLSRSCHKPTALWLRFYWQVNSLFSLLSLIILCIDIIWIDILMGFQMDWIGFLKKFRNHNVKKLRCICWQNRFFILNRLSAIICSYWSRSICKR